MRNGTFFLFFLFSICSYAQKLDTAAVRVEVDSLIEINRSLVKERKFEDALTVIETVIAKAEGAFGKVHEIYARCLFNHGRTYRFMRKMDLAESLYLETVYIQGKVIGKMHPDYAFSLYSLAIVYLISQNFEKAKPLLLEVKEIQKKVLGREHPDYANSLNVLGNLYSGLNDFEKAESYYLEAKEILIKVKGHEDLDYTICLGNLANFYNKIGNYEKAEPLYLEAKEINQKVIGEEHQNYAAGLNNLAILYNKLGDFEKSEVLFLEAKEVWGKVLGREHLHYASSLNNLAALYNYIGNYEKAMPLFLEAKEIRGKKLGRENPDYAASLNNIAITHENLGNYEKAESLYLEVLGILKKVNAQEYPLYGGALNNLASLYHKFKNYKHAESLLLEAKQIQEKVLGEEHPNYAMSLHNLASIYSDLGNYEKAESLYLEAKGIREKILGQEGPDYGLSLNSLGTFYAKLNNYEKVKEYNTSLFENLKSRWSSAQNFLSSNEMEKLNTSIKDQINFIQSASIHIHNPDYQDMQYQTALLTKSMELQTAKLTLSYLLQNRDSINYETYLDLLGFRHCLAKQYELPITERKDVAELEAKQELLEKQLARQSSVFRKEQKAANITQAEVKNVLKAGEAAIEFIHFDYHNPEQTDSTLYAAVILFHNSSHATFIPLFEEKQLGEVLPNNSVRKIDYVNRLYSMTERGLVANEELSSLYDIVWKPLDSLLHGVKTIYYSPSGLLNRLNIGAIPVSEDTILSQRYDLISLSSTRLLAINDYQDFRNKDAVVYGGIEFNYDSTEISSGIHFADSTWSITESKGSFGFSNRSLRGDSWKSLKWTKKESEGIEGILKNNGFTTSLLNESKATEESFKRIGKQAESPQVIHIATHGFFFPDPLDSVRHRYGDEPRFKLSEHPMIRSGLIMAGGNRVWEGAEPIPGQDDGILTAYEISQLNLTTTELVVLSACETGLGDIKGSEGVYGLQRAFKMAGVKYLIMSLWQVPDKQTQDLMTTFYGKWLEDEMSIPDAFNAAQEEMREKWDYPYFWAGFVLIE